GQIQVMSAGSGILHSEYNYSKTKNVRLFQIWIETYVDNPPRGALYILFY
ncbi:MAG: pirin family protein, partial [Candidatus Marinimicrobia bacterium]|nr:pirin family protein [Candidatus Neomarinimicrobiota bacterium]